MGTYKSDKPTIIAIQKIHSRRDGFDGNIVNGTRHAIVSNCNK